MTLSAPINFGNLNITKDTPPLQLDLTKKEDARAAIRLAVKKELRGKVPFSGLDNLLKEVIEQAEGQYRNWPMEA